MTLLLKRNTESDVRSLILIVGGLSTAVSVSGQELPSRLAEIEGARSRTCVAVLADLANVDAQLEPFALKGRRYAAIAQAILLEDRSIVPSLDPNDPVEMAVRDWFNTDALLAQRFVELQDSTIQVQRRNGRESIKDTVTEAIESVRGDADAIMVANQETVLGAGPCDGAVFLRPAVRQACTVGEGPLCDAVEGGTPEETGFLFVNSAEEVWELRENRPWSPPAPLQASPTGQLDGARTIGYARTGNIVVTVSFSPLLKDRTETTPRELFDFELTNQTLGLSFEHPSIAFAPAFGMRAALPEAIGGEDRYVMHFDDPSTPDVIWSGPADTGEVLEATLPMTAQHVVRFQEGDQLTLTAMAGDSPAFSIPLITTNQAEAAQALLGYMASQLSTDLNALVRPVGEGGTVGPS